MLLLSPASAGQDGVRAGNGGEGNAATALGLDRDQWGVDVGLAAAVAEEDTAGGLAANYLLSGGEGGGGEEVLGLEEVPTKDTLIAGGIGEAGRAEVEAFSEDNGGIVPGIEDGGIGKVVPGTDWGEVEGGGEGDGKAAGGEGAADEEGIGRGGRDWGEAEVGAATCGGGGGRVVQAEEAGNGERGGGFEEEEDLVGEGDGFLDPEGREGGGRVSPGQRELVGDGVYAGGRPRGDQHRAE